MSSAFSSSGGGGHGGLFSSSIFGGHRSNSIRPRTSSGDSQTFSNSTTIRPTSSSRTSTFGRKASFSSKSPKAPSRSRSSSNATISALVVSPIIAPEQHARSSSAHHKGAAYLSVGPFDQYNEQPLFADFKPIADFKPLVDFRPIVAEPAVISPVSPTDSYKSTTPFVNMLARPGTSHQAPGGIIGTASFPAPSQAPQSPTLEIITFQHIHETSSKRISTLDYLRKAHEGRVYWFNTLLFNKPDLQRMPYFDNRKLARRATNYLLLGLSLPTVLDPNASNPNEYLKTLNALLAEFESYQQTHPADGSSSLSRGRFPQMFKRAAGAASKGRRTSSAAEIGLPMGNDSSDAKSANGNASVGGGASTIFQVGETDLLPGEEYTFLLTPSLPFDPDFYETFATLCDVLIDCYTKLMSLVASPKDCNPVMAEAFTKADARVRKIIVQGVVKEFEDSSRAGVKNEVGSVGRVVLGGLM